MKQSLIHLKLGKVCIGKKKPICRTIPCSPNYFNGKHWAIKSAWRDAWKDEVWAVWQENKKKYKDIKLPCEKAELYPWIYYSGIAQDGDNMIAALKPLIDALKDCKIIKDDSRDYLTIKMPKYIPCEKANEHIELSIIIKK